MIHLAHIAVFAPLAGFLLVVFVTYRNQNLSRFLSVGFMGLSALASALLLFRFGGQTEPVIVTYPWLTLPNLQFEIGYYLDNLSVLMLFLVSFISFLVQVYSLGYMEDDKGKSRFFAYLSFFAWSMIFFVVASNLVQAYIFWELFGLASYLLIGFWFKKPEAAAAAKKAFVMTRLGDVGFLIGLVLLIVNTGTVSYLEITDGTFQNTLTPHFHTLVTFLIFLGMMGKSAQFPLHTWLPDAMEGPTPVSSLIHSATMVAAGVYLFARLFPFYQGAALTLNIILILGLITALVGATIALSQRDIKRIFAYSTISQLGFMMMALAAGSFVGGVFHLTTHAFFKATLFMGAGFLIHKYHTNDLYEIAARGARKEKCLMVCLGLSLLALSGIPPLSGFFSKDTILETLGHAGPLISGGAFLASFFTAFYSFKVLFALLMPKSETDNTHSLSAFSKRSMLTSITILTGITVLIGWFSTDLFNQTLLQFLGSHGEHSIQLAVAIKGVTVALLGALIAFWDIKKSAWGESNFLNFVPAFRTVLERKYYIDDFYGWVVKVGVQGLGNFVGWFDRTVIDGVVNGIGRITYQLGKSMSQLQNGSIQFYLFISFWVVAGLITYLVVGLS